MSKAYTLLLVLGIGGMGYHGSQRDRLSVMLNILDTHGQYGL
jgi:hypothetical protein